MNSLLSESKCSNIFSYIFQARNRSNANSKDATDDSQTAQIGRNIRTSIPATNLTTAVCEAVTKVTPIQVLYGNT